MARVIVRVIRFNAGEASPTEVDMSAILGGKVFTQLATSDNAASALIDNGFVYSWETIRVNSLTSFCTRNLIYGL
jgi:alpha-tubulin suppressor-like RCC1 family protein